MTIIIQLLLICVFTYVWKYITNAARETLLLAKRRFGGATFADLNFFFSSFDADETESSQIYAQNYITRLAHRSIFPDCLWVHMKSCE